MLLFKLVTFQQWAKGWREAAGGGPTVLYTPSAAYQTSKTVTSGERNFIKQMKIPIFLEAVLPIETI